MEQAYGEVGRPVGILIGVHLRPAVDVLRPPAAVVHLHLAGPAVGFLGLFIISSTRKSHSAFHMIPWIGFSILGPGNFTVLLLDLQNIFRSCGYIDDRKISFARSEGFEHFFPSLDRIPYFSQ